MIRDVWDLPARHVGKRVIVYSQTDSTNSRAAEAAGQPGLAFLADEQTAGRGQHGRTWVAPPRASVLLSVLLSPPPALSRPAVLTAWAAVSVCEVVRRLTDVQPRIKWPNDVLVQDRKIAGILIERAQRGPLCAVVAGIGLNVQQTKADLDAAGLPDATSLRLVGMDAPDTDAVARLLLQVLDEEYSRLMDGKLAALEAFWTRHLAMVGRSVILEGPDGTHRGRLMTVGFDGIALETETGSLILAPEAVRHLAECADGPIPGS